MHFLSELSFPAGQLQRRPSSALISLSLSLRASCKISLPTADLGPEGGGGVGGVKGWDGEDGVGEGGAGGGVVVDATWMIAE